MWLTTRDTLSGVPYTCSRCHGAVDFGRTPLESGLVRLAALGADGFELAFDDAAVLELAGPLLGPCPHEAAPVWDAAALAPVASRGWDALVEAALGDARLADLALIWRPRALALAGRSDEVSKQDALRARLGDRLTEIAASMEAARARGDDDEAQRLHARYIELGMTYAGRMAMAWTGSRA